MMGPNAFFTRIDALSLTDGQKAAGLVLAVSVSSLKTLLDCPVEPAIQARVNEQLRAQLLQSKLLPKKLIEGSAIVFWKNTLIPRVFHTSSLGGSIGADPETYTRLEDPERIGWLGEEVAYTPHNCDTGKNALALMVMVQVWTEFASSVLYQAWRKAQA